MITDPDQARSYLSSLSQHQDRPYDTALMHPDLALKLANAIQQARNEGMPVGLLSGVRQPSDHPSAYDLAGDSSHEYGLAADVSGIGPAGSATSARWRQIAEANGLSSPYDPNGGEWNHWQIGPKLETSPTLLTALKTAKASGDTQAMWSAYDQNAGTGDSNVAQGPDNRQIFFDALKSAGLNSQQALGVLWSLGGESGPSLNTASYNPNDPGGSVGAGQWMGSRRWALEEIAQREGKNVTDPHVQAQYLVGELTGNLQGAQLQPGVLDALKAAKTPEDAARIWTAKFERPKVDNSDQRIANGAAVGSLDANGNFVPGTAKAAPAVAAAGGAGAGAGGSAPAANAPAYAPPSPMQTLGQTLGQAFASMGGGGGGSAPISDPVDQPAIRSMAAETDFMPSAPNPVPAQFTGGAIGSQLGALAAQPNPSMLENPQDAPSITAGAPSMTSMLGDLGTTATPGLFDNRGGNQLTPNPYRRVMRLA